MSRILYGQPVAEAITSKAAEMAAKLRARGIVPALALIRVGTGGGAAGAEYERLAVEACAAANVEAYCAYMPDATRLESNLDNINRDPSIHGAVFLRPLTDGDAEDLLRRKLDRFKDVNGVSLSSLAAIFVGHGEAFVPCPAKAAMELLDYYGVELSGKRVAIIGRSLTVGKPLGMLMLERDATVTLCHADDNVTDICSASDVIVCGMPDVLSRDCFRAGQTLLDLGDNITGKGNLSATDLDTASSLGVNVAPHDSGVPVVSHAVLALHTVQAAALQNGLM